MLSPWRAVVTMVVVSMGRSRCRLLFEVWIRWLVKSYTMLSCGWHFGLRYARVWKPSGVGEDDIDDWKKRDS